MKLFFRNFAFISGYSKKKQNRIPQCGLSIKYYVSLFYA